MRANECPLPGLGLQLCPQARVLTHLCFFPCCLRSAAPESGSGGIRCPLFPVAGIPTPLQALYVRHPPGGRLYLSPLGILKQHSNVSGSFLVSRPHDDTVLSQVGHKPCEMQMRDRFPVQMGHSSLLLFSCLLVTVCGSQALVNIEKIMFFECSNYG